MKAIRMLTPALVPHQAAHVASFALFEARWKGMIRLDVLVFASAVGAWGSMCVVAHLTMRGHGDPS
jgi:hypothetical protein